MFVCLFVFAGCFYSTAIGELRCYENPKNIVTAIPATDEEFWGATFKVQALAFSYYVYSDDELVKSLSKMNEIT